MLLPDGHVTYPFYRRSLRCCGLCRQSRSTWPHECTTRCIDLCLMSVAKGNIHVAHGNVGEVVGLRQGCGDRPHLLVDHDCWCLSLPAFALCVTLGGVGLSGVGWSGLGLAGGVGGGLWRWSWCWWRLLGAPPGASTISKSGMNLFGALKFAS